MFSTPRRSGVKRRLFATPGSAKRGRFTNASRYNNFSRRYRVGPSSKGTLSSQVKSLQRVVKTILPEIKFLSLDLVQTNITTSGTVQHISAVAQGVTDSGRIGEDIRLVKINIKGRLSDWTTTGSTVTPTYYRYVVVQDKQQVADSSPSISDVFSSTDPSVAQVNVAFAERFRVLYMSPLITNSIVANGNGNSVIDWAWSGDIKVGYNGTAGSDVTKNGVFFMIMTTDGGNVLDFTGNARVCYTDV